MVLEVTAIIMAIVTKKVYYVHYITPSILIVSLVSAVVHLHLDLFCSRFFPAITFKVLALFIIHYEQKKGLKTGVLLFAFWLGLTLSSVFILRSHILHYATYSAWKERFAAIEFMMFFALVLANLVFSCITEKFNPVVKPTSTKIFPENYASLFAKLTFSWVSQTVV